MINENFNMQLIEEKINTKFLELQLDFESKNQAILSKLKEINSRIDKIYIQGKCPIQILDNISNLENELKIPFENQESLLETTNSKREEIHKIKTNTTFDLKKLKENEESSRNNQIMDDDKNRLEQITKRVKQLNDNNFNKINLFQKKIEEIKKDNSIFKELLKKTDKEFDLIKLRFSEVLDFIKDKNFWKKFITEIIYKNRIIINSNKTEIMNDIYSPFNYYKYFDIEGNKNFMDEANNTIQSNEINDSNKSLNMELKNILIKDQIKDKNKYKTPNIPTLNINKIFRELNSKPPNNINHHNKSLLYSTSYKKIQTIPFRKYKKHNSLNEEDKEENIINSINSYSKNANSKDNKSNNINNQGKRGPEVNEYILRADFSSSLDINKNKCKIVSKNLSEAYILKQLKKLKKLKNTKNDQENYQTLPLSMKYNIKNKSNNSLDRYDILSYKDFKKGNIEDLYYSQLKRDKIGQLSQKNFKTGYGNFNFNSNVNNNINSKRRLPVIFRDKSK